MVTGVDAFGITTGSTDPALQRYDAMTKIWAAGVEASRLGRTVAAAAGATVDRAGRVQVEPDFTLPGHPEIFVVGDTMSRDRLPGVAEVAMQSGRYAAKTILRRLAGRSRTAPLPLPRPRVHGDDLAVPRHRRLRTGPRLGVGSCGSCGSSCTSAF